MKTCTHYLFLLGVLSFALLGCDKPKNTSAVEAGGTKAGGTNAQKTKEKPPVYDSRVFKVGQTWVWKMRLSDPKKAGCEKWEVIAVGGDFATIEVRKASVCGQYANTGWRRLVVFTNTGVIDRIIYSDDTTVTNPKASIFSHLNGDDTEKFLNRKKIKLGTEERQIYQISGEKSWYIDAPETPLHAVLWQNDDFELVFDPK